MPPAASAAPPAIARSRQLQGALLRGPLRPGRLTKRLVGSLRPGDLALIDHAGLDRCSAEALARARAVAVLNASRFDGGRCASRGAELLARAGVVLVQLGDDRLFSLACDEEQVVLELRPRQTAPGGAGSALLRRRENGELLARGQLIGGELLRALQRRRAEEIGHALERFAVNTARHVLRERALVHRPLQAPELALALEGRPAVVVARGPSHREDLRALSPFIADRGAAIVAVDGAADAVLDEGLRPELIVGDMDSASARALACGAELVVHSHPDGRAPGRRRLDELQRPHLVFCCPGVSEDAALLLCAELGAEPVVAVGCACGAAELLERGRAGMSSTLLTRLRLGEQLIDARGLSRLLAPAHRRRPAGVGAAAAP